MSYFAGRSVMKDTSVLEKNKLLNSQNVYQFNTDVSKVNTEFL